ncbi:MAG: FAD-dependent oxidoreductase [Nanoarchaeota archaeon]|nr:FAD-dependent oxidoreductase [Nanoarchaeota archaeon]
MKKYDLIIIGAGPAGLTAAVYAARYKLNVLVIGKLPGGLAGEAYEVCNFPSYGKILGFELMKKMMDQVKELGVEIKFEEVLDINNKNGFEIATYKEKYFAKKLILALGSERRRLQLENEREFMGKGVSYCATCDSTFYKDKIVGIVGGSDAAITSALLLAKHAKQVYVIYRKDSFTKAEPIWIEQLEKEKKIKPLFNSVVTKLIGTGKLEEVEINEKEKLKVDGLFVEIGSVPNIELAKKLKLKLEKDYIVVDKEQRTNVVGIFAAGDVTNNSFKQIITACAEGAVAAKTVYEELEGGE